MKLRSIIGTTVATAALFAAPATAPAAITVANTNDSGPGSLRQTVAEAPPGETINVPAGTYTLTSAPLAIAKSLTLVGASAPQTVIRAGGPFSVIDISGEAVELRELTIRDGAPKGNIALGGGINVAFLVKQVTLNGVSVLSNVADASGAAGMPGGIGLGGGIYMTSGKLTIADSTFSNNKALANGGAGKAGNIALGGGIYSQGETVISGTTVSGSVADARGGQGAPAAEQDGNIALGGGVYLTQTAGASSISASTVSGNVADASPGPGGTAGLAFGGGIYENINAGTLSIVNATIAANAARGEPGGGAGQILGGGLYASVAGGASLTVLATTIADNRVEGNSTTLTAAGNVFANGGGPRQIANSVISGGVGPAGSSNCGEKAFASLGFNLESLNQCEFAAAGDQIGTNPLLGPLAANGGPTPTMLPAAGSPLVDQGRAPGLGTDQRRLTRPVDLPNVPNSTVAGADGSDIGAVELQLPPVPVVPIPQTLSNAFRLGKVIKNRKKGRAKVQVLLPQPSAGLLQLKGKGVKAKSAQVNGQAQVYLAIVGKKNVREALNEKGKRKVGFSVTYQPNGAQAATQSRRVKLLKKSPNR